MRRKAQCVAALPQPPMTGQLRSKRAQPLGGTNRDVWSPADDSHAAQVMTKESGSSRMSGGKFGVNQEFIAGCPRRNVNSVRGDQVWRPDEGEGKHGECRGVGISHRTPPFGDVQTSGKRCCDNKLCRRWKNATSVASMFAGANIVRGREHSGWRDVHASKRFPLSLRGPLSLPLSEESPPISFSQKELRR